MPQTRKRLSGPEKIAIVKRSLVERVPISDLRAEHGLKPRQIYRWQAAILAHRTDAFDLEKDRRDKASRNVDNAPRVVGIFDTRYNTFRLRSALCYVTLAARDTEIFDGCDSKREAARAKRLGEQSRDAEQSLTFIVLMCRCHSQLNVT